MFDPFGDYETRGYLRNVEGIKDLDELKYIEHGFFESNLEAALAYLHAIKGSIAYVHFLEVLLVHAALCHRAGFAINWNASRKDEYLEALTRELENPQGKHLDSYLLPLVVAPIVGGDLRDRLTSLPGLDGEDGRSSPNVAYRADDPLANRNYLDLKRARGED